MSIIEFLFKKNNLYPPIGDFIILGISIGNFLFQPELPIWLKIVITLGIVFPSMNLGIDLRKWKEFKSK